MKPSAQPDPAERQVEAWLRDAGPRNEPNAQRQARVREAVAQHWQARVTQRRRRRHGSWAAGLAAAAALVVAMVNLVPSGDGGGAVVAAIELLEGSVAIDTTGGSPGDGPWGPGARLTVGARLRTSDGATAALRYHTGHLLRLDRDSDLVLADGDTLELRRGAIYLDSRDAAEPSDRPRVLTPLGTIEEIGTRYEVRIVDDVVRVRVREGRVRVQAGGQTTELGPASTLDLLPGAMTAPTTMPIHGPEWRWTHAPAVPLEINGKPALEFLRWAAREGGWRLRFEPATLETGAAATSLSGEVGPSALEDMLEAVLSTCDLKHRVEGDQLIVEQR